MIRRPPRSTQSRSSAASDVYKRQSPESPHLKPACPNRDGQCLSEDPHAPSPTCSGTSPHAGSKEYRRMRAPQVRRRCLEPPQRECQPGKEHGPPPLPGRTQRGHHPSSAPPPGRPGHAGPRDHESTQSAPPPDDGGELPPRGVQTTAAPQTTLVLPSCARPPLPRSALGAEGLRKKHGQQYHPTYPLPSAGWPGCRDESTPRGWNPAVPVP